VTDDLHRTRRERGLARVRRRPDPADWDDEDPLTLDEAVAVFFPDGPLTVSSLRTEIRKGNLRAAKVAGRFFVTPAALRSLFDLRAWVGGRKEPGSTCGPGGSTRGADDPSPPSTSSAMDRKTSARVAALSALQMLKSHSRDT
jgi:hypothetical protein